MKCIRKDCKNNADISIQYGVLPCKVHQQEESSGHKVRGRYDVANVAKLHRIQAQRDHHGADMLQPYDKGRANPDYFKNYPDQVDDLGVRKELEHD